MAVIEIGAKDRKLEQIIESTLDDARVTGWWYELGHDATGDPCVWIWLVIPDDTSERAMDALLDMTTRVGDAVRKDGRFWPYFHYRTKSEQEAVGT